MVSKLENRPEKITKLKYDRKRKKDTLGGAGE